MKKSIHSLKLDSIHFTVILILLYVSNYLILRVPFFEFLLLNNQGVESGRIELLDSSLRKHLADVMFLGTLALAILSITLRNRLLDKKFHFLKRFANPYVVVFAIVWIPSILGIKWPSITSSYFMNVFGIGHLYPNFGDLRGLFSGISNVAHVGEQIPCLKEECVPTTWVYGRVLLSLPSFHLSSVSVILISLFLTVLLISQMKGLIEKDKSWKLSLFIATPPFVLLIERQNIEILIVLLAVWAAKWYQKEKYLLSIFAIAIGSLIKFYPIVLLIFFIVKSVPLLTRILALCVFATVTIFIIPDISALEGRATPGLAATFGLRNVLPWIDFPLGLGQVHLESWLRLIFLALSMFLISALSFGLTIGNIGSNSRISLLVFSFCSTISIFSWAANSNYAYRAIFFIIPLLLLGQIVKNFYVTMSAITFYMLSTPLSTSFALQRNLALSILASMLIGIGSAIAFREHFGESKLEFSS